MFLRVAAGFSSYNGDLSLPLGWVQETRVATREDSGVLCFPSRRGLTPRGILECPGKAGTSGFLSVSDSDRRVPAELGQVSQASSCLRKGTPLASRVAQGVSGPSSSCAKDRGLLSRGAASELSLSLEAPGAPEGGGKESYREQKENKYMEIARGIGGPPGT